jgi:hypothetical protein
MRLLFVSSLILIAALWVPAHAQQYVTGPVDSSYNQINNWPVTDNTSHVTRPLLRCIIADGTGTIVVHGGSLSANIGDAVNVSNTGTGCDNIWTLTGVNNFGQTYTFSSGLTVSWYSPSDQNVSGIHIGSTYYRAFTDGIADATGPATIQEQSSNDGTTWSTATTIAADTSGGCSGQNYNLRMIVNAAMPNSERFAIWTVYRYCAPVDFLELDSALTSGGVYGPVTKFTTPDMPTELWKATADSPANTRSDGAVGLIAWGCPSSGCVGVYFSMYKIYTCDNGVTWGQSSINCPNAIRSFGGRGSSPQLPTNEITDYRVPGTSSTWVAFDRNQGGGSTWSCTSSTICPLIVGYSTDDEATWTWQTIAQPISCAAQGTETTDYYVSPILINPGLSGQLTLFVYERCIVAVPLHNNLYLKAYTFSPPALISNVATFPAATTLWSSNYTTDGGYPSVIATSQSHFNVMWDALYPQAAPLKLLQMPLQIMEDASASSVSGGRSFSGGTTVRH